MGIKTSPPILKVHNLPKNIFKKIKSQKTNLKTLNLSIILPWVANKQRQNFCIFEKFFQDLELLYFKKISAV